MATQFAPIALFTYKRLDSLKVTVAALRQNFLASESDLFIFSDGAKTHNEEPLISDIRKYLKTINGFKNIYIFEAKKNKGLANSIIDGVTQVIREYSKIIVLEDDLITTPNFLSFMNACLDKYKAEDIVFSISGFSFNLDTPIKHLESGYFLPRGWSWGWATWFDRWKEVDWEVKDYLVFLKDSYRKRKFAQGGSDLNSMLRKQMNGKSDSWAVRWFYYQFKVEKLTFYPVYSKILNIGFDNNATHTTGSNKRYIPHLDETFSENIFFPINIAANRHFHSKFLKKMGLVSRMRSKMESLVLSLTGRSK